MGFGEIFSKSWKEYGANKKEILKLMLIFYAIPFLIVQLIIFFWLYSAGVYNKIAEFFSGSLTSGNITIEAITAFNKEVSRLTFWANTTSTILSILISLILLIAVAGLITMSLKKEKYTKKEIVSAGKDNYWKLFAFFVVNAVFLIGLFILLIIPGIIFMVYWMFGAFVLVDEKRGIKESLKRSHELVKGKWWKTFGYILLLTLVVVLVYVVFMIPSFITQGVMISDLINGHYSMGLNFLNIWLSFVFQLIASMIIVPLEILFFKNFYLELKKRKK